MFHKEVCMKMGLDVKENKNQIKVLLDEVDYLDGYLLDEIINAKVDYLIGSVHFLKTKMICGGLIILNLSEFMNQRY